VDHTGLDNRARPDGLDRIGQALQPVADEHEHVLDAAVLNLGEDTQPVLGALTAVAGPDSQDVAVSLDRHAHDHVDRTVRDLPVPDLGSVADLVIRDVCDHDRRVRLEALSSSFLICRTW
jgi:hypothetical protein